MEVNPTPEIATFRQDAGTLLERSCSPVLTTQLKATALSTIPQIQPAERQDRLKEATQRKLIMSPKHRARTPNPTSMGKRCRSSEHCGGVNERNDLTCGESASGGGRHKHPRTHTHNQYKCIYIHTYAHMCACVHMYIHISREAESLSLIVSTALQPHGHTSAGPKRLRRPCPVCRCPHANLP